MVRRWSANRVRGWAEVRFLWHLSPMEEEQVHPDPAATKHPVPGPGISPVGETSWRGAKSGKAVQETPWFHLPPSTSSMAFKATPQAFLLHPVKVKANLWEMTTDHRHQARVGRSESEWESLVSIPPTETAAPQRGLPLPAWEAS